MKYIQICFIDSSNSVMSLIYVSRKEKQRNIFAFFFCLNREKEREKKF